MRHVSGFRRAQYRNLLARLGQLLLQVDDLLFEAADLMQRLIVGLRVRSSLNSIGVAFANRFPRVDLFAACFR